MGAYETVCGRCEEPLLNCICENGPTVPDTPTDRKCTICGADPNTAKYKQALWNILRANSRSEMFAIAENVMLHDPHQ